MINTQSNSDMKHCLVLGISQRKKSIYFIEPIIGLVRKFLFCGMVTDKNILVVFMELWWVVKTRNSTVTDDRENSILHIIFDWFDAISNKAFLIIWQTVNFWVTYFLRVDIQDFNPIPVGWVSNWYLPAVFPLFEAWFSLWIRATLLE